MIESLSIEWVDEGWPRFDQLCAMLYAILYEPFGVDSTVDWYHHEPGATAVALSGTRLLGSARLLGCEPDASRQLRQVAVEPAIQRQGIGRALVLAAHRRAAEQGAHEVWLNARDSAFPFYAALGYGFDGEMFVSELTRIPHRRMRRELSVSDT